jgi:transcription elongation factor GreA
VVEVVGHGVGQVSDVNLELDTIKVDVGTRRPVSVPFGAIARYLRRLPVGDFRRRAVEDPEAVRIFASSEPGNALVELLESFEEPTDVASIKRALKGIVAADGWTAWWNKARSDPRVLAFGTGSRLRYSATGTAESATDVQLAELRTASPRDRLSIARRIANRDSRATPEVAAVLGESLPILEHSDPGLAWETTTILVELDSNSADAANSRARLVARTQPLRLLSGVQDRVARVDALAAIQSARPDDWIEVWAEWLLHERHPMVLEQIATTLGGAGQLETLDASLEAVFRNHTDHPDQFVWACEEMAADDCPEPLRRRMTPSVLEKIPDTLSRSEFAGVRGRAKALLEGGRVAVRLILETASPQQAERFISRISRISSVEPQRLSVLKEAARQATGTIRDEQPPALVATRAAIESKRAELKQLLEVDIPLTLKGIQSAAAEGDLRENFEYHMLRDRQELQSARAAALQRDLRQVLVLEPGAADASRVNVGTVVEFNHPEGEPLEPITILGSWDADVQRRIFASGSGLAQRLLGREAGDEVELDGVRATIRRITPWIDQR